LGRDESSNLSLAVNTDAKTSSTCFLENNRHQVNLDHTSSVSPDKLASQSALISEGYKRSEVIAIKSFRLFWNLASLQLRASKNGHCYA
jgi:hypothetical protein